MNDDRLLNILLEPRITEKSTMLGDKHQQFVFKVALDASKPEIRQAVEKLFEVEVQSVQVVNVRGKGKMFKNMFGARPNWKKAYVRLKPGFDINFVTA